MRRSRGNADERRGSLERGRGAVSGSQHRRVEGYLKRLSGYAFCLTNDRDQARDLVQECAVRALSAARVPRDEAAYRAWIFTILRNLFIDRLRRQRETNDDLPDDRAVDSWQVWHCDESLVTGLTVKLGLEKLKPAHREILGLVDIAGFTYHETAQILGVPPGTVMSRVSRARQALLDVLADSNVRALPLRRRRRSR